MDCTITEKPLHYRLTAKPLHYTPMPEPEPEVTEEELDYEVNDG